MLVLLLLLSMILSFVPNELVRSVSVLLLAAALIVFGYKLMKAGLKEKNESWRQAAEKLGLLFTPGSFTSFPSIEGRMRGRKVKATIAGGRRGKTQGQTHFVVESELTKHVPLDAEIRREKNSFYREAIYKTTSVRLREYSPRVSEKNFYGETNDAEKTNSLIAQIENDLNKLFEESEASFFAVSMDKVFAGKKMAPGAAASEVDASFIEEVVSLAEKI